MKPVLGVAYLRKGEVPARALGARAAIYPPIVKFTVICVSTSTGSPFSM
jgi:hypothetical protein